MPYGFGRSDKRCKHHHRGRVMWEYIVIGHAALTIYLVISMYNTLRMGVICDPVVLLEVHHENPL